MARLSCGELQAFITAQCGAPRLCQLIGASAISWGRKLDDVSDAQVIVPVAGSDEGCCDCLAEIEPWCHELQIFRNGIFVWGGPITRVTYGYDEVKIDAQDVLAWTGFRIPACNITSGPLDLTAIAMTVLNTAFAEHDPCVLDNVQVYPAIPDSFVAFECFDQTALEQMHTLSDAGIDFTVLGRSIIISGADQFPLRPLGILTDEMILGEIEVIKDGLSAGNRFYIHYKDDDDVVQCSNQGVDITSGCPCSCPAIATSTAECGRLEHMLEINDVDYTTAQAAANAYLSASQVAPRSIDFNDGTRISPETPWDINDMVPGQRVDVALTGLCIPIYQSFRLLEVSSKQEGLAEEEVSISLGAINTTGTI